MGFWESEVDPVKGYFYQEGQKAACSSEFVCVGGEGNRVRIVKG